MSKKTKPEKSHEEIIKNRADVARALEILFADDYISKKRLYLENFLRGIFFSAGGIIGATIIIALLVWIFSLFDQIPLIGPLFDNARESIEKGSTIR